MNPDKLFDYLDGKLSPADRGALEEKLMSDAQLRHQFNIAREIHRSGKDAREVMVPSEDPATVERSGRLGRRIAVACAVLVFLNVAFGLAFIFVKNRKSNLGTKEAEIREQLALSLGAAAHNAMPTTSFVAEPINLTALRTEWDHMADRIIAGASAFDGSATKALLDDMMTVIADIPSSRAAEFRQALTSATTISPMPAIAPAVKGETAGSAEQSERTYVEVRIAETPQ